MDWLVGHEGLINALDKDYSLDYAKQNYEVIELVEDQSWLVLNKTEYWMKYAVLQFAHSNSDRTELMTSIVFHGEGTINGLNECRHTWFGDEGYVFYLPGKTVIRALQELSKYFDDMI